MSAKPGGGTGSGKLGEKGPYQKLVATNRKARYLYNIQESFEAGIELEGSEVKSLRLGQVDLSDGFGLMEKGELFLFKVNISTYQFSAFAPHPTRKRKLLVRRDDLRRLIGRLSLKGMAMVPLRIYFNERGWAKIEMGIAKGKKGPDRRDDIRKRQAERDMRDARRV